MVCAVFGPVWAEWRQTEAERKGPGAEPIDVRPERATVPGGVVSDK